MSYISFYKILITSKRTCFSLCLLITLFLETLFSLYLCLDCDILGC